MIVMETVTITSITIDVTVKVTVDEGAVLRMFIDDLYANPNIVDRECASDAANTAYRVLAPAINGPLSSRAGFNWGRLMAEKTGNDTYTVTSPVECYPDPDEDSDTFIDRVLDAFAHLTATTAHTEFSVADVERTGV